MQVTRFTGGSLETNCFLLHASEGNILIDAPGDTADWLASQGHHVDLLLLTHAHFDHTLDAARVIREHGCPVGHHRDGLPMLTDPNHFRAAGFEIEVEPVHGGFLIGADATHSFLGERFHALHVPGHCPGSLCFLHPATNQLFGGDVLFAGGIGRWDLPGGDLDILLDGIHNKILTLPDETRVLPGHGPSTTIGAERASNPFLD